MEDDVFLRCIEANMLSDLTLRGIDTIAKVCIIILLLLFIDFFCYRFICIYQQRRTRNV